MAYQQIVITGIMSASQHDDLRLGEIALIVCQQGADPCRVGKQAAADCSGHGLSDGGCFQPQLLQIVEPHGEHPCTVKMAVSQWCTLLGCFAAQHSTYCLIHLTALEPLTLIATELSHGQRQPITLANSM
ncbi:hypothetical protein D3C85_1255830 [compost metagenome]